MHKALVVLEKITAQRHAIGLADLRAQVNLPRQTLHRTLLQLEDLGLITRDPVRDKFYVGPRLSSLATGALFSENHNMPARAILQRLVDEIGESCNIGVLDGMSFLYLDRIQTDKALRIHLEVGARVPAYCTSGGKLLLAYLPESDARALIRSVTLKAHTDRTITNAEVLEGELALCRKEGYSTNDGEYTPGIVGVATPITDKTGRTIAAVACHAPSVRVSLAELKQFIPRLRTAARELGEYWG